MPTVAVTLDAQTLSPDNNEYKNLDIDFPALDTRSSCRESEDNVTSDSPFSKHFPQDPIVPWSFDSLAWWDPS